MKAPLFVLFLFLPTIAFSQDLQSMMNQGNMQKMMEQAQKMQVCIQNIGQEKMEALEQRSVEFEAEIKSLCDSGKRDKAEKKALSLGKEMKNDPTVVAMGKCAEMMQGMMEGMSEMMPEMPFMDEDGEESGQHICDEFAE